MKIQFKELQKRDRFIYEGDEYCVVECEKYFKGIRKDEKRCIQGINHHHNTMEIEKL